MDLPEELRLDSPGFLASRPHRVLAALRRDAPVYFDERTGAWLLSRHDDVLYALRDPRIFSSRYGTSPDEREHPELVDTHKVVGSEFLLTTDPPRHTELRNIFKPGFSRAAFDSWEVRLRRCVRETLDELPAAEPFDAYENLARTISLMAICDFVGIPRADAGWVRAAAAEWTPAPRLATVSSIATKTNLTLEEYFTYLLADRARQPRDDLLTAIAGRDDDDALLATKLMFCIDTFVAGDEPTAEGIAGGLGALIEYPSQAELLLSDAALVPGAVEEILRWVSPIPLMCRTTMQDVEIRDAVIPANSYVYLLLVAANRDDEVWERADQFEVRRPNAAKNVSFGRNAHACIGAGIVRRVLRVLLEELIARFEGVRAAGPVERRQNKHMPFITKMPVVLEARSGPR
ncbi:MAG: cytochrome P450 [Actinobacteria bacterium]|nr:cytochrome P450 [Actinomycetota bacterium]